MHKNRIQNAVIIHSKFFALGQIFLIYAWLTNLPKTNSFFSVYCIYAVSAICCLQDNYRNKAKVSKAIAPGLLFFSTIFSLSVILGNHELFLPYHALMSIFNMMLCFGGGFVIALNILLCALHYFPLSIQCSKRVHGRQVFLLTFASVIIVDLVYLYFTNYPAIVNWDTVAQLSQMLGLSPLSNFTPYWHTMTISFFYNIGYRLFQDPNAALATYTICQILFFAACFAYVLLTMYELGVPKLYMWLAFFLYVLYPYNIVFNITILKDVLFGCGLLLMITALLRILTNTGKSSVCNYIAFVIGSIGFCLWRTNGIYIYLVTAAVYFLVKRYRKKAILLVMCCVLLFCWFLNGPWLESKQVQQAPLTEALAVPFQQIGRVIVNEREIPQEFESFLDKIFYLDKVKDLYNPGSVDPMKFDLYRYSSGDYLARNFDVFLKIWIQLGIKYPGDYLLAWADETRGYWDGGYHMGVYDQGIPDNTFGIDTVGGENAISSLFAAYFRYIEDPNIFAPLKSIGFVVWLVLACWWLTVLQRRRTAMITVPILILLIGLWVGTPVFAEFRYAYPVFLTSPIIAYCALFDFDKQGAVGCDTQP